jgi:hypothetical protein
MVSITKLRIVYWSLLSLVLSLSLVAAIVSGVKSSEGKEVVPSGVAMYARISYLLCLAAFVLASMIVPQPKIRRRCEFGYCTINRYPLPKSYLLSGIAIGGICFFGGIVDESAVTSSYFIFGGSLFLGSLAIISLVRDIIKKNQDWERLAIDEEATPLIHVQKQTGTRTEQEKS